MRALIQEVKDADDAWAGHDPEAAGRYWAARGALDAACHPSTIDDDGLDAALRALDDERQQTQRRMIAALYWRAGVAAHLADVSYVFGERRGYTSMRNGLIFAARAMEAACPR